MRSSKLPHLAIALVLALGLLAAGCGGDDEPTIPDLDSGQIQSIQDQANQALEDATEQAQNAADAGAQAAQDAAQECLDQAEALPDGDAKDAAVDACQQAVDTAGGRGDDTTTP